MAGKEGQFDVVELMVNDQFKTFSINLNAQHVNGMTPFDLALSTVIRYSRVLSRAFRLSCTPLGDNCSSDIVVVVMSLQH